MIPGAGALESEGVSNTALKRIPLMLTVRKEYDYFSDFIGEFGAQLYPEGMFIPTERPKSKGAAVRIDFRMRDGFQILLATGVVVRADLNVPGAANGMWVSFKVLDPEHAALIKRIVDQREAEAAASGHETNTPSAPIRIPHPTPAPTAMGDESSDDALLLTDVIDDGPDGSEPGSQGS